MEILDKISELIKDIDHLIIDPQSKMQTLELKQLLKHCKKLEKISMRKSYIDGPLLEVSFSFKKINRQYNQGGL